VSRAALRRLVITVCLREPGVAALPVERGGAVARLDAAGVARAVSALARRRRLTDRVTVRLACAGGCTGQGPNVSVAVYTIPRPGERADGVAVAWRTYVGALPGLDCLARVVEENLA
jgi:hypothetical protein